MQDKNPNVNLSKNNNTLRVSTRKYENNIGLRMLSLIDQHPKDGVIIFNKGQYQNELYERAVSAYQLFLNCITQSGGDKRYFNLSIRKEE